MGFPCVQKKKRSHCFEVEISNDDILVVQVYFLNVLHFLTLSHSHMYFETFYRLV